MLISHQIVWVSYSLATPLEPLGYRRNVASFSLFYRYYFGRCSSVLDELVPLPPSCGRSTRYSNRLHDLSVAISGSYKNIIKWDKGDNVKSLFPCTPRLYKFLPTECFPFTYDLSCFMFRVNRCIIKHLFLSTSPLWLSSFISFSFNFMPRTDCSVLHGVKNLIKKLSS